MQHFVCIGKCSGESESAGVCQDETCSRHDQPLSECSCADGLHREVLANSEAELFDDDLDSDDEDEVEE